MDWTKMGAIAGIGCFMLAVISVALQLRPWPWWKGVPGFEVSTHMVLTAALIGIGFVFSGISIWSAWHLRSPGFAPIPANELKLIEGQQFINEQVELDGKSFRNCRFINARLLFHGRNSFDMVSNNFVKTIQTDSFRP